MLRGVDENELLAGAGPGVSLTKAAPAGAKVLDDGDVAALFGLEMAETTNSDAPVGRMAREEERKRPGEPQRAKTKSGRKALAKTATKQRNKSSPAARTEAATKSKIKSAASTGPTKRRAPQAPLAPRAATSP